MAITNRERVGRALELLKDGLNPYLVREMRGAQGHGWWQAWQPRLASPGNPNANSKPLELDIATQLRIMREEWNAVFGRALGNFERNLVHEISDYRNRWAHQEPFTGDDTDRALDSISRLLRSVSAADQAAAVDAIKQELRRVQFAEQARQQTRRVAAAPVEGQPAGGLKPWREMVTPHRDVASGRYQTAEFAADLGQVHRGEGAEEYRDPTEFFRRTFLTEGLKLLLRDATRRLANQGGDPVIELQTNFGGGKTHAMLALYHLCSATPAEKLPGMEIVLQEAAAPKPEGVHRAVLVGTALSPGQTRPKPGGIEVRTLWGELAWQLGGSDGYSLVAEADRTGVSPGSDALRDLFALHAPCLILIDEWVAFVRQLYNVDGLPAGSFDANLTFAQALTEAARQAPQALVVASIPASDIEIGGEGGKAALDRLRNTFGRMQSAWRPASAEEGFEIVRRRLFEPITDPKAFAARDAVINAFGALYKGQPGEFPPGCGERSYERRLAAAYPIHPELFDRLYTDWSSLDRFQRTRGVLRLMASVIHRLWERQDGSLLILPSSIPIDESQIQSELRGYLEDPWDPVIAKDVDGPASLPLALDRANPSFGRYSACRRVARTLFLGSAPTLHTSHRGLDDRAIKLGCAQPGESVATFGDALRRLTDEATHLYVDNGRYWFSTQPSVTRLAQDRAAQQDPDVVLEEIRKRLRAEVGQRGDFTGVHACPGSSSDVPDNDRGARLVILGPEHPHIAKTGDSPARQAAAAILDRRGESPRLFRNALVTLAADRTRLADLDQAVRQFLAWQSIEQEINPLNLDPFQANQAKTKREGADETVKRRIPETYTWLLVPEQEPQGALEWQELRLQGDQGLAIRAGRKLVNDGLLIPEYAPTLLRRDLDRIPLWRGDHVGVRQLADDYAQYLYLPRLRDSQVLLAAIQAGAAQMLWETETFAYAERWDETRQRYVGLRVGAVGAVPLDEHGLVVRPEGARRQLEEMEPVVTPGGGANGREGNTGGLPGRSGDTDGTTGRSGTNGGGGVATIVHRRFYGSVNLDPISMSSQAGKIAEAVVQHLAGLLGADVEVTLEVTARVPAGVPDDVVRIVTENCRTLKFGTAGFEDS